MVEMKASPAVKLDTLSDVNDLGKPAVDGLPSLSRCIFAICAIYSTKVA